MRSYLFPLALSVLPLPAFSAPEPDCPQPVWEALYKKYEAKRQDLAYHLAQAGCRPRATTLYEELFSRVTDKVNLAGLQVDFGEAVLRWCKEGCCQGTYTAGESALQAAKAAGEPHGDRAGTLLTQLTRPLVPLRVNACEPQPPPERPTWHIVTFAGGLTVGAIGLGLSSLFFKDAWDADQDAEPYEETDPPICEGISPEACVAAHKRLRDKSDEERNNGLLLAIPGALLIGGAFLFWHLSEPEAPTAFLLPTPGGATLGVGFTF